jgi:hypothetical protein
MLMASEARSLAQDYRVQSEGFRKQESFWLDELLCVYSDHAVKMADHFHRQTARSWDLMKFYEEVADELDQLPG